MKTALLEVTSPVTAQTVDEAKASVAYDLSRVEYVDSANALPAVEAGQPGMLCYFTRETRCCVRDAELCALSFLL